MMKSKSVVSNPIFGELTPHVLRELADKLDSNDINSLIVIWLQDNDTEETISERCWCVELGKMIPMIGAVHIALTEFSSSFITTEDID